MTAEEPPDRWPKDQEKHDPQGLERAYIRSLDQAQQYNPHTAQLKRGGRLYEARGPSFWKTEEKISC